MPRKIQPPTLKMSGTPRAFPRPAGTFLKSLRKRQRHEGEKSRLSYVSNRLTDAAAAVSKMRRSQRQRCSNKPPSFRNSSEVEIDFVDNSDIGQVLSTLSNQLDQDIEFDGLTEHCHTAKRIFSVQAQDSRTSLLNSRPSSPNPRKSNFCDESIATPNHSPPKKIANDLENTEKPSFCQARDSRCEAIDPLTGDDQDYDRVLGHIGLNISSGRSEDSDDAMSIPSLSLEEVPTDATAQNGFKVRSLITAEDLSHSKTQDSAESAVALSALAAMHGSLTPYSVLKDDLGSKMRKKGLLQNLWNDGEVFDDTISLSCDESVSAANAGYGVVDDCSIPDLPELFSEADTDGEVHCGTRCLHPPLVEADDDMLKIDISAPSNRTIAETNKEKLVDSIIALSTFSELLSSPVAKLVYNNNHKSKSDKDPGNLWLEKGYESNTDIDIVSLSSGTNSEADSVADVIDLNFIHQNSNPEELQCDDDLQSIPSFNLASKQTSFHVIDENTSFRNFFNSPSKAAKNGDFNGTMKSVTSIIAVAASLLAASNFVQDANVRSSRDVISVGGMDIISISSNSESEDDSTIESFIGTVYDQELHLIDDEPRYNLAANNISPSVPPTQSAADEFPGSVVEVDSLAATTTILSPAIVSAKTRRIPNRCTKSPRNVWVGRMFDTEISISLSSDCDSLDDSDDINDGVNSSNLFIPAASISRKDSVHRVPTQEIDSIANCLSDESMEDRKTDVVSNWDDFTLSTSQSRDDLDGSLGHTEIGTSSGQNEDSNDAFSIPSLSVDKEQGGDPVKVLEVHNFIANPRRLCLNPQNVAEASIAWSVLAAMPRSCAPLLTLKHDFGSNKRNKSLVKTLWNESGESESLISLPYDEFASSTSAKEGIVNKCSIPDLPELSSETSVDGMVHCRKQNLQPSLIEADNDMRKLDISDQMSSTAFIAHEDLSAHSGMDAKFDRSILLRNDFDEIISLSSDTDIGSLDTSLDGASMNHCEDIGFIDIEADVSSQSVDNIEDAISMPSLPEVAHRYIATTVKSSDLSRVKCEVDPHSEDVVESAIAWSALASLLGSPVMSSALNTRTVKSNNSAVVQNLWGSDESEDMISLACDDDLSNGSDTIVFMDEETVDEDEANTSRLWWPLEDHVNKDNAITGVLAPMDSIAALSALFNVSASKSFDEGTVDPTNRIPQTIWLDDVDAESLADDVEDSVNAHLCRERITDEECRQDMCLTDSQHGGDVDSEPSCCTRLSQIHHVSCHPFSTNDCCYKSLLTQRRTFPMSDALTGSVFLFISMATWMGPCDPEQRRLKKGLYQDTLSTCCDNVRSNGNAVDNVSMSNDHYDDLLVQSEPAESDQTNSTYSILRCLHREREFYSYPKKTSTATDDDGDDITVPMTPEKSVTGFGSQDISLELYCDLVEKKLFRLC